MLVRASTIRFGNLRALCSLAALFALALAAIAATPAQACHRATDTAAAVQQIADVGDAAAAWIASADRDRGDVSHASGGCASGSCAPCSAALAAIATIGHPSLAHAHVRPPSDTASRAPPGRSFRPPRSAA